jgi:DNA-binding XRE family transcriptional regulator
VDEVVYVLKCELRNIRKYEYKMDLMGFVQLLEVNYTTYRAWERDFSRPNLEAAIQIAKKLNRHVEDIWHE